VGIRKKDIMEGWNPACLAGEVGSKLENVTFS
jgi:hypothetical protein